MSYFTEVVEGQYGNTKIVKWGRVVWVTIVALIVVLLVCFIGAAGCKSYNRYQKRADAKNAVQVTHIQIDKARQQAKINRAQVAATKAEASKRIAEAQGIKVAQRLIAGSLTPLYVQHEAIDAMRHGAGGDKVYIPVGAQGVPLVADVSGDSLNSTEK